MKLFRYLFTLLAVVAGLFTQQIFADTQETRHDRSLRERDFESLREFLLGQQKIDVNKKEK